tara:strand:+ start:113 stop:304 length:192 start_codon:yes stop_codon:yes gene_type:complete
MNDFEFILEDIIFKKKVKITEDEYYDVILALMCASEFYNDSTDIKNRKKSREFLRLKDKLRRC